MRVKWRVMSVTFHQLELLLLARVHNELKSVVIAVGREVQFDEAALRDEQSTALDLAAEEARVSRVVQGRGPVVNLRVSSKSINSPEGLICCSWASAFDALPWELARSNAAIIYLD